MAPTTPLYRTAKVNQFTPLDESSGFPKYLAAFSLNEATFSDENASDGADITISPRPACQCGQYNCKSGLSYFDFNSRHGLKVSSAKDAPQRGSFWMNWVADTSERNALIKSFEKNKSVKYLGYCCFEYDGGALPGPFSIIADGGCCTVKPKPAGHHTLHPTSEEIPCHMINLRQKAYAYHGPILEQSWSCHCLVLQAASEPKPLVRLEDPEHPDWFHAAHIVFNYLDVLDDATMVASLIDLIDQLGDHDYDLGWFAEISTEDQCLVFAGFDALFDTIDDSHEARCLSSLKQALADAGLAEVVMYGDEIETQSDYQPTNKPSTSPVPQSKVVVDLPRVLSLVSGALSTGAGPWRQLFPQTPPSAILSTFEELRSKLIGAKTLCVLELGSVVISLKNVPEKMAESLLAFLEENGNIANLLHDTIVRECKASVAGLPENIDRCSLLAVTMETNLTSQQPMGAVRQELCNTYCSIFRIASFSSKITGTKMCILIDNCLEHFRDNIWGRKSQRVMVLCLSPFHRIDFALIYTDEDQSGAVPDYWLEQLAKTFNHSVLLQGVSVDRRFLTGKVDDFFLLLFTFDLLDTLHRKAEAVMLKCLGNMKVHVVDREMHVIPAPNIR